MQLTGTNRSIGLIALIFSVHRHMRIVSSEWRMETFIRHSPTAIRPSAERSQLASFSLSFAGLVVLAKSLNPIPSRTRPLNSSAPMVLWLKPWESRSLPGLPRTRNSPLSMFEYKTPLRETEAAFLFVRGNAASSASFRHDPRSACEAHEPPVLRRLPALSFS